MPAGFSALQCGLRVLIVFVNSLYLFGNLLPDRGEIDIRDAVLGDLRFGRRGIRLRVAHGSFWGCFFFVKLLRSGRFCGWPAADDFWKIFLIVVIVRFFRNKTEIVHGVLRNTGTVRRFLIAAVRISCVAGRRGRGAAAFLFLLSGWKRVETGSALPSGARFCTVFAFFFVVILPVVRLFPRFKLEEHACCGENGRDNPEHHVQIEVLEEICHADRREGAADGGDQDYGNAFERNADQADHESDEGDESITCDIVWIDEMPEAKADEPADQKKKSDPVEDEGNDCGQKTDADGKRQGDRRGLIRVGTRCITGGRAEKKSGNDAPELAERIAEETVQQGKNNHNQKKLLLVNIHDVPDFIETAKQRVDVESLHIQIHDIHSYMMYRKNRYRLYFSTERRFWQVKLCLRSGKRQNGGGVHMV